jgi:signal transduction histidine kinase
MQHDPVNILLVDDQPGKLLTYQAILEGLGETLLVARSAREAMQVLFKSDVALMLIDVNMPEINGFELAEMIRGHPRFEKMAMMFVSAVFHDDLNRLRGYATGAVDYVTVPVVPELLRIKVRTFADLYRKTRQLELLNRQLDERIALRTAELEASTARVQESDARLHIALASARAGAWDLQFDTGEMRWSPELLALLGLPAQEAAPRRAAPLDHVYPADRDKVQALLAALPHAQGSPDLEFRVRAPEKEGELLWLRMTGQGSRSHRGEARGILQDVTSHKLAELALEHEAQRKDQFLATLCHELRDPLAPLAGSVRLLRTGDPEARQRYGSVLERQLGRLEKLVDNLLEISRISQGLVTLEREPVDLTSLLQACLDALAPRAQRHRLSIALPERDLYVAADPLRLAQVISHLLDRALHLSPAGGRVEVRLQEVDHDAELRVIDSGQGVPAADLDRIFHLFAHVEESSGQPGLNVGLPLVRRLVELHGGKVWAYSEGAGTELTMRLPLLQQMRERTELAEVG